MTDPIAQAPDPRQRIWGRTRRSSRSIALITLAVSLVVVLIAGLALYLPRLAWEDSPYGYQIVETAKVPADQPWVLPLPLRASADWLNANGIFAGVLDVYTDPALTRPIPVSAASNLTLTGSHATLAWRTVTVSTADNLPEAALTSLGDAHAWPAGVYYVVERENLLGQRYARPRVHVYTVEARADSVDAPAATMTLSDEGVPRFEWSPVANATAYRIIKLAPVGVTTSQSAFTVLGSTDGAATSWLASSQDMTYQNAHQLGGDITSYNEEFRAFGADGAACQTDAETGSASTAEADLAYPSYAVIAVDDAGNTSWPIALDGAALIGATPVAVNAPVLAAAARQAHKDAATTFLPKDFPVVMGDCHTEMFPTRAEALVIEPARGSRKQPDIRLQYGVDGTLLTQSLRASGQQSAYQTIEKLGRDQYLSQQYQLGAMEDLGYMDFQRLRSFAEGLVPSTSAPSSPYHWNGSSEMVTYIAANLFAGEQAIDLTAFMADPAAPLIRDAANEAFLQNPYITDAFPVIGTWNGVLYVDYEQTPAARATSAARIKEQVDKVTASIIDQGMSARAKALAINKYLATTAVYDHAALEYSQKPNLTNRQLLERFPNAWDAEGVLVDKTGVCVSYAAAFKALADAVGLETVTVTGFADDSGVGHEWIKARIDGHWRVIDPTWNSNVWEQVRGDVTYFFGMTDAQADRIESNAFVVNSHLDDYRAI